jgi:hypothetical protein
MPSPLGREHDVVRMVVVGGVPSPWGEAAKGILHVKNIEWAAVRLERPRAGWAEILLLSERLAPNPSLLPKDAADRARCGGGRAMSSRMAWRTAGKVG